MESQPSAIAETSLPPVLFQIPTRSF